MSRFRTLIVDDEPLARERLLRLLRGRPDIEILGECSSGFEALEVIHREHPEIVLHDLQMPGCNGLEVAGALRPAERPAIIFVSAHDRFAVEAFGVKAVDYLLKPFDEERLVQALARAMTLIKQQRDADLVARSENRLAQEAPPAHLTVHLDGGVVFARKEEIVRVEAAGNYSILHLCDLRRLILRETLARLEGRLGTTDFVRINRSDIVRRDRVKELMLTGKGDHAVRLFDGTQLPLSRNLRGKLEIFAAAVR